MPFMNPYWRPGKKKPKPSTPPAMVFATGGIITPTGPTPYYTLQTELPPEPELKDVGLAIEPIVGTRMFCVEEDHDGIVLCSMNGCAWPKRKPLYAQCGGHLLAEHEVPEPSCMCGIYAWKQERASSVGGASLWGEVYLWGDVLVCDFGYRAEIAYPKELHISMAVTRASMRVRDALEEAYGIPVTLDESPERGEPPFPGSGTA